MNKKTTAFAVRGAVWAVFLGFVYHSMPWGHQTLEGQSMQNLLLFQLGNFAQEAGTPKMFASGGMMHLAGFVDHSMPWGYQTLEGQSMQSLLLFQLGNIAQEADTPKMAKHTSLPRWKYRGTRLLSQLKPFCHFFVRCLGKAGEVIGGWWFGMGRRISGKGRGLNPTVLVLDNAIHLHDFVDHSMPWGHQTLEGQSMQSLLLFQLGNFAHEAGTPKMAKHTSLPRWEYRGTRLLSLLGPFCHFFVRCLGKAGEVIGGWRFGMGQWIACLGSGLNPLRVVRSCCFELVIFGLLVFIGFDLRAQEVLPLTISDRVPESFWKLEHAVLERGSFVNQKMEVYRGKALILDFWGTYCVPCINAFPKLEGFQEQFKEQLQFLAVNSQSKEMVSKFFEHRKALSVPVVANDAYLHKLFPHQLIPNEVWIDASGIVSAFTSGESLDSTRLRKFLGGSNLDAVMKYDQDLSKPLFFSEALPISQLQSYAVFIKGRVEGTGASFKELETAKGVGVTLTNTPLIFMLNHIGNKLIPDFSNKLLLMNRQDSMVLYLGERKGIARKAWYQEQEVSVNLLVPKRDSARLYLRLMHLLDESSEYHIKLQKEKRECLILKLKDGFRPRKGKGVLDNVLQGKGEKYLRNGRMNFFVAWFNEAYENMPIMVDETHLNYPIDLELGNGFHDVRELQEMLLKQGYVLGQGTRTMQVIAVKHK